MGELDKAAAKVAAEKEAKRVRIVAATEALYEKVNAIREQEKALNEEMLTHADSCPLCADTYVRSGKLAYKQCSTADKLGMRDAALFEERQRAHDQFGEEG